MGKKGKKKKTAKNRSQKNQQKKQKSNVLFNNIIVLIFSFLIVLILYRTVSGYKWLWDSLVIGNLQTIKQYPNLSNKKKWEIKLGFDYRYVDFIKNNTPENAVILMPPDSALFPPGQKSDFNTRDASGVKNKAWTTYFLYPRKLVYDDDKETNPYYDKINYVAIANYWGYDKLKYPVQNKQKYQILPIKQNGDDE